MREFYQAAEDSEIGGMSNNEYRMSKEEVNVPGRIQSLEKNFLFLELYARSEQQRRFILLA
jgi:hypothetical protein